MIKLTQEEKDTMSYDDVAYLIIKDSNKKIKTPDLFKKVIKAMALPEEEFSRGIGDFFELLITDKRFILLEDGYWDLKINHNTKITIDEDEEDIEDLELLDEEEDAEEQDLDVNYDDDAPVDDEETEDLEDLLIIDDTDESDEMIV